jgi:hypothetical protein
MKKFALILAALLSLNIVSAQVKLFDTEITREERTLKITSNINDVKVRFSKAGENYRQELGIISNGNLSYTFSSISMKQTNIEFYGDHVETKKVKLFRYLKNFTNPFSPNSYALAFKSRSISVDMNYKQEFMLKQYQNIEKSDNIELFKNYIKEYPESSLKELAVNKKDSLELWVAILSTSKDTLEKYISLNPSSKFKKEAEDILSETEKVKEKFQQAKENNTKNSYYTFTLQNPKNLFIKEAYKLYVYSCLSDALTKYSLDSVLYSFDSEVLTTKSYIDDTDFKNIKNQYANKIDKLVSNDISTKNNLNYNDLSKIWNEYNNIQNKYSLYFSNFETKEKVKQKIIDHLYSNICELVNDKEQNDFIEKVNNDFPKIVANKELILPLIVDKSNKANGTIVLHNKKYLNTPNSLGYQITNKYTSFTYKGINSDILASCNKVKLVFKDNFVNEISLFDNELRVANFFFKSNNLAEINYHNDGNLAKAIYDPSSAQSYFYEFEKGVNLSLKDLEQKILKGEEEMNKNNYDNAIEIFSNGCKNSYPKNIDLNKRLELNIKNAQSKKYENIPNCFYKNGVLNVFKLGNHELFVSNEKMSWHDVKDICKKLGKEWFLPSKEGMKLIVERISLNNNLVLWTNKEGTSGSSENYEGKQWRNSDYDVAEALDLKKRETIDLYKTNTAHFVIAKGMGNGFDKVKNNIDDTYTVGNLKVSKFEFIDVTYNQAVNLCNKLGKGWRIPTRSELQMIRGGRNCEKDLSDCFYYSNTATCDGCTDSYWSLNFNTGKEIMFDKSSALRVIPVLDK